MAADGGAEPIPVPPAATPHAFKASVDKAEPKLGDIVMYTIEIRDDPSIRYFLPEPLDVAPFALRDKQEERTLDKGEAVTRISVKTAIYQLGEPAIPELTLRAETPQGPRTLVVPAQKVKVASVIAGAPGEAPQPKDIRPPVPLIRRSLIVLWIALGAGLLMCAIVLLVRWLSRPKALRAVPPPPPRPAEEIALAKLARLVNAPHDRIFFFTLSEILREYLGRRFAFDALDMTTAELCETLSHHATPGLDYDAFVAAWGEGDLYRFANVPPSEGACKKALESARELVLTTTRAVAERARAELRVAS